MMSVDRFDDFSMSGLIDYLFGAASFMPHGYCLLWRPDLVAMHAVADVTIAASYFSIPAAIYVFVKKRGDIAFGWVAWLFVGFIAACGLTHILGLVTLWQPLYGLQGLVKLMTAGISLVTASLLWPLLPKLLALPSPAQLRAVNLDLEEANARQQEVTAHLQSIFDNSADALITIDETGRIEAYNRACERIFGYSAEEALGRNVSMLMHEDVASEHDAYLARYLHSSSDRPDRIGLEVDGRRKDGSSVPLEITVSEICVGDNRIFSGILRDVTERKAAEARREELIRELQANNRDLESTNRDLDDFAYIASHDLREPLRAVSSHANILLEDHGDKLDEDGENRLNRVIGLSYRLEQLTADLLYFSRLGRADLALESVDPKAILAEIETVHAEFLAERQARIVVADGLPLIQANGAQIMTLFQNLIVNGVKYNDSEDKVIEIGFEPSVQQGGERYENVFFVRDNGIGIKDMFKTDVFRIFKRLNKDSAYGEGTGAGLSFVKKIVENHGGAIWLESTFGEGTTFYFTLRGMT